MAVNTPAPKILQSQRSSFFYLEFCRVHMDGDRLVYSVAQGAITREWNIPTANTSILMLGSGCSITQAAARKLASEKTLVAFTGGGGFPGGGAFVGGGSFPGGGAITNGGGGNRNSGATTNRSTTRSSQGGGSR